MTINSGAVMANVNGMAAHFYSLCVCVCVCVCVPVWLEVRTDTTFGLVVLQEIQLGVSLCNGSHFISI